MEKKTFTFFALLVLTTAISAQCTSSAFFTAGTVANDATVGLRTWVNTGNTVASDNVYSSCNALIIGDDTHYLLCTNFGFSIPSASSICGIEAQVEKGESGLLSNITDLSVKIVKAGNIIGNEQASGASWSGSDGSSTYGSSSDTWGISWTPADVNATNFGLAFAANMGGISVLPSARIDQVKIRVWYNNSLPVELTGFTATCINQNVLLQWETATETQNDYFEIQYSGNGNDFIPLVAIRGNGTTNVSHEYQYVHTVGNENTNHYYRLAQVDFNGSTTYHEAIMTTCEDLVTGIHAWQNNGLQVQLNGFDRTTVLSVIDLSGHLIATTTVEVNQKNQVVLLNNTSGLRPGYYLVAAQNQGKTYTCKTVVVQP